MSKKIEMAGRRFGKLVVLSENGRARKEVAWLCQCDCGKQSTVAGFNLRSGNTRSCGCHKMELPNLFQRRHGVSDTKIHRAWMGIRRRCENPKNAAWENYGGRGIRVCERWAVFENFMYDMGQPPSPTHEIDRIDVNGNYEPGNCRWITPKEQNRNKRNSILVEYNGRVQCLSAWGEEVGLCVGTLRQRLCALNWPVEKALFTPALRK